MNIQFVLFDSIGTTISERNSKNSIIISSFIESFAVENIHLSFEKVNKQRGKSKLEAINELLLLKKQSLKLAPIIYSKFISLLKQQVFEFAEMEGATDLFLYLKGKRIQIGLGSGLPEEIILTICKNLNWKEMFDYIGSSEKLGKGRPNPIMIVDAMKQLSIKNPKHVLKIGDSVADIEEGRNAGVITAAVLTGTQDFHTLQAAKPDFIFENILGLKTIL